MANLGQDKIVFNLIIFIVSYKYNNNELLLWRYIMTNVYEVIGICNICFCYMIYESDKTCVQSFSDWD